MLWHENPQVWTAIVAYLALFVSVANLLVGKINHVKNAKQKLYADLQSQSNQINDAFAKYDVDTPYQVKLDLKGNKSARAKVVLLVMQLNLLNTVYKNRANLSHEEQKNYTEWGEKVLRPWIESDHEISKAYVLLVRSGDGGEGYTAWLQSIMKIVV